jgi:hypothetical protein
MPFTVSLSAFLRSLICRRYYRYRRLLSAATLLALPAVLHGQDADSEGPGRPMRETIPCELTRVERGGVGA